jgi:hypothetical protein
MHGRECDAPVANIRVRRIPADVLVAKLPFGFIAFFPLYMYVA